VIGKKIPLREGTRRAGDPAILCASPKRLIAELGWRPRHSDLDHILRTAWSWKRAARTSSLALSKTVQL